MGPSIKYVTLFLANFEPLPYHTLSHIPGPPKYTPHISEPPPIFSRPSTKPGQKPPVQILSQLFAGVLSGGLLSEGLLSGRICPGWFSVAYPGTFDRGCVSDNFTPG